MGKMISLYIKQYIKTKNWRKNHRYWARLADPVAANSGRKTLGKYTANSLTRRFMGKVLSLDIKQRIKAINSRKNRRYWAGLADPVAANSGRKTLGKHTANSLTRRFMGKNWSPYVKQYIKAKNSRKNRRYWARLADPIVANSGSKTLGKYTADSLTRQKRWWWWWWWWWWWLWW